MAAAEYKPSALHWMPDDPGESLVVSYPIWDAGAACCGRHDARCDQPDDRCCDECAGVPRGT